MRKNNLQILVGKEVSFYTVLILICVLVSFRLVPHPPNFSPIFALSFFFGYKLKNTPFVSLVIFLSLFISDFFIGFYSLAPIIYILGIASPYFGKFCSLKAKSLDTSKPRVLNYLKYLLSGSMFFFLLSNLAVWLSSGMYSLDLTGFVTCFVNALPFYQNSLAGDMFYSLLAALVCFAMDRSYWLSYQNLGE